MSRDSDLGLDALTPPFDRYKHLERLEPARSGHHAPEHARHQLYLGREKHNPVEALIKVTTKPGRVYETDLVNEIRSLSTINAQLPNSRYFPFVHAHGRLADGRLYLITSFFDEFPLATSIGEEPAPEQLVAHLRIALEIAKALMELHGLGIVHVDLNPMNVLHRASNAGPVIRLVDFESSYDRTRYAHGEFYSPPTTAGYSAPEIPHSPPDARSDLFSLAAVLYSLLAGYRWTDDHDVRTRVESDAGLDTELRGVLLTALAPAPDDRYRSVKDFRTALGAYLERIWPGRTW